ncbi:hypothetical protein GS504_01820 [Rhodococcus hoagii]|nr:hypothetical protein [Prescottella equi]
MRPGGKPSHRLIGAVGVIAGLAVVLAGCSKEEDTGEVQLAQITAPPEQGSSAQQQASEEAISAAGRYYGTFDRLQSDPAKPLDQITTVASGDAATLLVLEINEFRGKGWLQTGSTHIASSKVTSIDLDAQPRKVSLDVCVDASGTDARDTTGQSAISPKRPDFVLQQLVLTNETPRDPNGWRVIDSTKEGKPCDAK